MNTDWNWFFSSFCQSAAALIGIIAAFIISRLLGLNEKINSTISHFRNLDIEYDKIVSSIKKRRFNWYTYTNVKYDSELKEAIRGGEYEGLKEPGILKKIYANINNIYRVDEAVMKAFNELYEKNHPIKTVRKRGNETITAHTFPTLTDTFLIPVGIWDKLREEKETINQLEIEANTLVERFSQNHIDLQSFEYTITPLRRIIIVLMISFPLTVIYPLHFMPVPTNQELSITFNFIEIVKSIFTLKFFLLFVFFLSIEGIFSYFLYLTIGLSALLKLGQSMNTELYRDIKSYSEYFEFDDETMEKK